MGSSNRTRINSPRPPASLCHGKSAYLATLYGIFLSLVAGSITVIYHHLQNPTFHQNAYGLLTAVLLFRSWYLMETRLRKIDPACVNVMWWLCGWGLAVFLVGFGLWNVDNAYCGALRTWRRGVGLPWGIVSEGHGWWHLFSGVGAYYYIIYGEVEISRRERSTFNIMLTFCGQAYTCAIV